MGFRLALAAGLVTIVLGVWWGGVAGELDAARLERWIDTAGPLGPGLFIATFALAELVHLPAVLFLFAAAAIWPLPAALATGYLGALVAALFVVFVARYAVSDLARKHLLHRLPERLRGVDERLAEGGLREVVMLRLITFMLPAAHWVLGISKARPRDIVLGTAIGILPGVALAVLLGQSIVDHWQQWRPFVLGAVAVFVVWRLGSRWLRRRRQSAIA